jgi:hypothetical protein
VCLALGLTCVAPVEPRLAAAGSLPPEAKLLPANAEEQRCLESEAAGLAARWAPAFLQHTSSRHPERDRPLPVDFDGDWDATNNWSNLSSAVLARKPVAYFSTVLTETHAFLTYTLFYPRDWIPLVCVSYACHDNDLEVVMLVVERDGNDAAPARLAFVESKFHSKFVAERGAAIARTPDGRPLITIESEGHGMTPAPANQPLDIDGAVLFREGTAAAMSLAVPSETYSLLPLSETLWPRRRPDTNEGRFWSPGDLGWLSYRGTRFGRLGAPLGATMSGREFVGGVRPPWGIDPNGNRGDWFLDPAFGAVSRHPGFFAGRRVSLDYSYNPYVQDLRDECAGESCSVFAGAAVPAPLPATFPLTTVGLLLLGFRRGACRERSRRNALAPMRPTES